MKEFVINKFIKLKLEDDKTIIYVNNERFNQCKFLLLDIPIEEMTSLEDIESIDDIAERLHRPFQSKERYIPPEVEFWGHCSNIQVWYENNYKTKLIHRNLAFPLLKKLTEVGDKLANRVFKEEIAVRFKEGNDKVKQYLGLEGYLGYLNREEFSSLLYGIKFNSFSDLLGILSTYSIVDKMATSEFLEFIDSLDEFKLKSFVKNPKKSNRMNLLQAILEDLGDYKQGRYGKEIIYKILKKIGVGYFEYLMSLIIDKNGYINLPVLESAVQIEPKRVKDFLNNTKHKFKFGFGFSRFWEFHYILNPLLACFTPEELMIFLEKNHKISFLKMVFPEMPTFGSLNMASKINLDMKHYITAFFLEDEEGGNFYLENLKKLGDFLVDTFLSELVDGDGEIDEIVKDTLQRIGGDAEIKLEDTLYALSKGGNIYEEGNETYKEYLKRLGVLKFIDREEFCSLFNDVKFKSFNELLGIINDYSIVEIMTAPEFLEFIDSLDEQEFKDIVKNPKESNRMNLLQAILERFGNHKKRHSGKKIINKILKKIGTEYFEYLMSLIIDKDGCINLPVLESAVQIDPSKVKDFLKTTRHRFKFEYNVSRLWEFQHILNPLLVCFTPEELMIFLENNHRDDFLKVVFPKMHFFGSLNMATRRSLDMKHYIAAFLLEEAGEDFYLENLKKLGGFLADIFLSELINRYGEVNENIKETLECIGEETKVR